FRGAASADRPGPGAAGQLHQWRAVGQAHAAAVGHGLPALARRRCDLCGGASGLAGAVGAARRPGAPAFAAVRDGAGRRGDVRGAVAGVDEAAAALSHLRPVRADVRRLPLCGGIRAPARHPARLPRVRLGDDGADTVAAADRRGVVAAVAVAPRAHLAPVRSGDAGEGREMKAYLDLLRHVLEHGTENVFGWQMRFDLADGFPLVTTKKLHTKSIVHELIWFLRGDTNIAYLKEHGVSIWDEWADAHGNLGPVYGKQWRAWPTADGAAVDQIRWVVDEIRRNPDSRRLIVSAWNVGELSKMALMPCHTLFQFYVADGKLSCQLYQRSGDIFLGVPFNIASYALLTHMVAQVCGLGVGDFVHTLGDAHLYNNHVEQARLQLGREPLPLPRLLLNPEVRSVFDFRYEDVAIEGYQSHPAIKGVVAV